MAVGSHGKGAEGLSADAVAKLRAEAEEYDWWHTMDLGHGIVTKGRDETPRKLGWIKMPERLDGKTVLDIGAWDGFFSFEAERRGAARVLAVDSVAWQEPAWGPRGWGTKRGFEIARRALGSRVEDLTLDDFAEISVARLGKFDVVLLLGVLYHMRDPWSLLERAAEICGELLIVETHVDLMDFPRAAMAVYPGSELVEASNWCGPNLRALEGMLRHFGFPYVEVVHRESRAYRYARAAYRRIRGPRFLAQQGRCSLHARRSPPRS